MKVKVTEYASFFTKGKVYDVIKIDSDGDEFFLHPRECIFVDTGGNCPTCKGSGRL